MPKRKMHKMINNKIKKFSIAAGAIIMDEISNTCGLQKTLKIAEGSKEKNDKILGSSFFNLIKLPATGMDDIAQK